MTNLPTQPQVQPGKAGPNVFTALLLVAIVTLVVTAAILVHYLTAQPPQGYGLSFADLFGSWAPPK